MFTRITENGGRRYLQIVESFRNEAGKPRLRVVANLGRVDEITEVRQLWVGCARFRRGSVTHFQCVRHRWMPFSADSV